MIRDLIFERIDEPICFTMGQSNAFLIKALKGLAENGLLGDIKLNPIFKSVEISFKKGVKLQVFQLLWVIYTIPSLSILPGPLSTRLPTCGCCEFQI